MTSEITISLQKFIHLFTWHETIRNRQLMLAEIYLCTNGMLFRLASEAFRPLFQLIVCRIFILRDLLTNYFFAGLAVPSCPLVIPFPPDE